MARNLIKYGQVADSRRLFDMISRQQLYIEGVKQSMADDFREVTRQISEEFSTLLAKLNYRTLDGMTKAELNRFIVTLRKVQNNVYSVYTQRLLDQLYLFMQEDKKVNRAIYAAWLLDIDDPDKLSDKMIDAVLREAAESGKGLFGWLPVGTGERGDAAMWSAVANAVIPASGAFLGSYLAAFAATSQLGLENLVRRAYANAWTVSELLDQVDGTAGSGFRDGLVNRINNNANESVHTITQHVAAVIAAAIASVAAAGAVQQATGWYRWVSIIDRATSDICRHRNNRLYRFGVGPRPPAHPRCRSQIMAARSPDDAPVNLSYYQWVMEQPPHVIVSLFAPDVANAIQDGTMTAERLGRFASTFNLTADEYGDQLSNIIRR